MGQVYLPCTDYCLMGVIVESLECGLLFTVCINMLRPPHYNSASAFFPPVAASTGTARTIAKPKHTSMRHSPGTLPTSHSQGASTQARCPTARAGSSAAAAYTT